jgi:subtilisin family serine protease
MAYTQIRMIGGDALHDMGFRGEGMLIAVLDAGFAGVEYLKAFDLLRKEGRIVASHNFVDPALDVYRFSSHGCYVLSTMAAEVPGLFVGTAPRASYLLLVTEDVSSELLVEEDNWIAGAEFADSIGADVCNTSLGYTTFDDSTMDHHYYEMDGNTTRITRGADIAASRGMLIVNSAGNSGSSNWHYIGAPADGDSVLAVGAVNRDSIPADFSSYGPAFDGDIKPNVAAIGWGTYLWSFADSVRTGSGTSFSSPIIAGMAACLWQAFPERNNMDIFHAIERSGHRYENPDDRVGYGIPNFSEAAFYLAGGEEATVKDSLITVSPNPTTGKFQIAFRFEEPRLVTYSIYDISGQLHYNNIVYAYPGTAYAIPVFALQNKANGVYLLRVDVESKNGNVFHQSALRIIKIE